MAFEYPKDDKRKWTCYVCGEEYETYDIYKAHIIGTHEEGREWIGCPVCEAPVRDMKFHFDAKHPNRICPKNIQLRVTVWRDFAGKVKKQKFKDGHHESPKMGGALIHYRSGYELDVYKLLDQDRDVATYQGEPFKVPYNFKGKWHDYVPDIKVNYVDGAIEIWEIKPASQKNLPRNVAKWKAMQLHCEAMGWNFTVILEDGITKLKKKIQGQMMMEELDKIQNPQFDDSDDAKTADHHTEFHSDEESDQAE